MASRVPSAGNVVIIGVLDLAASVPRGYVFQLHVSGTQSGQTDFTFCGPVSACAAGHSYRQGLGVPAAYNVRYAFERASPSGMIYVFRWGSVQLLHDVTVLATYSG